MYNEASFILWMIRRYRSTVMTTKMIIHQNLFLSLLAWTASRIILFHVVDTVRGGKHEQNENIMTIFDHKHLIVVGWLTVMIIA